MNILLIRTFFATSIPDALFEAAKIDGATEGKIFRTIVLPLGKPILVTIGVFSGLAYWNDWTNGLYYIGKNTNLYTIQNLLNKMVTDLQFLQTSTLSSATAEASKVPSTGVQMAIAFVAILPILIIFPFLQKYYANKLKFMLSGGDALDVFPIFFDQAPSYVNNGQIVNLKDYIEDYGSGIVETIGEEAAYGAQINGFLYGLPAQKESNMLSGVVMRKDMVEKYGIDVESIKELSDLTPIFEKIHAGEPNMTCITGVNFVSNSQFYDQLSDGFGCLDMHGDPTKVVNYYETDTYMNICKIARSWYEAGYVLPDAATTTETSQNLMKAGNLFCYLSPIKPGFLIQEEANTNTELVTAYIGDTNWMATNNVHYFDWGIAQNSQDPAKAMEFLEFAYTNADFMNLLTWGIEGEHYVKVEGSDNVITFPEGVDGSNSPYHLNIGWELLGLLPREELDRIDTMILDQYYKPA